MIKNIHVDKIQKYIEKGVLFIDVRERYEQPKFNLPNHLLIPTSELGDRLNEIPKDGDVLIYCHSGARSADVVATLNIHYGYDNLFNVVGGALAMAIILPDDMKKDK